MEDDSMEIRRRLFGASSARTTALSIALLCGALFAPLANAAWTQGSTLATGYTNNAFLPPRIHNLADGTIVAVYGSSYRVYSGGAWGPQTSLSTFGSGGPFLRADLGFDTISRTAGHLALVSVAGTTGNTNLTYWVREFSGGQWGPWVSLGGSYGANNCLTTDFECINASRPRIASWGSGHMAVTARGTNGRLFVNTWQGAWGGWVDLGGNVWKRPEPVSWGPGHLSVFVIGSNATILWQQEFLNGVWSGWRNLGSGRLLGEPVSADVGQMTVTVVPAGQSTSFDRHFNSGSWTGFLNLVCPGARARSVFVPARFDVVTASGRSTLDPFSNTCAFVESTNMQAGDSVLSLSSLSTGRMDALVLRGSDLIHYIRQ
jgi:hypothetical protein